jgi:serine/threonine protein kinase
MSERLRDLVTAALGRDFEIEAEIGRGATGVVYRARDRTLERLVALKVLPPDLAYREEVRRRFLLEARTAARLVHPHVVPVFAVGERDGLVWLAMAYIEGESLASRLARERPTFAETRRILQEVADALAHAHSRGVVHRDVKPDNILLEASTGRSLVTDFGIARALEGDSRLTQTGVAVGSPAYMSPEQATGERAVDGRSDIYSLGVVGYQMIAGVLPFQAASPPAMLLKHVTERPRSLLELRPDAPRDLAEIVERALAKEPSERWPDAAALRDALAKASLEDAPASSRWSPRGRLAVQKTASPKARRNDRPEEPPSGDLLPAWMPPEWRQARRAWRQRKEASSAPLRKGVTIDDVREFRARAAGTALTLCVLAAVNAVFTPEFPWVIFPALGMGLGLVRRGALLWGAGLNLRTLFGPGWQERTEAALGQTPSAGRSRNGDPLLDSVPKDVLQGRYGAVLQRAASDRAAVLDALQRLSPAERELVPDVAPTVEALALRVQGLAQALHRLEAVLRPGASSELERRMEVLRAEPQSQERERRLTLLERQRTTLADLERQRQRLAEQLESAVLLLRNMRLDLLALRSAGLQSALNEVTSATQEARALSRDIQIALETVRELRD